MARVLLVRANLKEACDKSVNERTGTQYKAYLVGKWAMDC